MVIIALLLIAAAAVATVGVALDDQQTFDLDFFGLEIANANPLAVFLAGAASMLLLLLGIGLLSSSARRSRNRRQAIAQERSQAARLREERERLAAEKAELEARLERERPQHFGSAEPGATEATRVERTNEAPPTAPRDPA